MRTPFCYAEGRSVLLSLCQTKIPPLWVGTSRKRGIRLWRRLTASLHVSKLPCRFRLNANPILLRRGALGASLPMPNKNPTAVGGNFVEEGYSPEAKIDAPLHVSKLPCRFRLNANPILLCRGALGTSLPMPNKNPTAVGGILFGAGRGIRTPVPFGQTVFKTLGQLPKSSRIVPKPPQFSAKFSLFLAPSRKFARKLRERCEKPLKTT